MGNNSSIINKKPLTYNRGVSKNETYKIIKAIGIPVLIFLLQIFTVSNFAAFGIQIISPATALMWIVGFIVALLMPGDREEVLKTTMIALTGYCGALLGLKLVLGLVSGASSEMIAASFNQAIPTTTGNAIPGYIQNILWFTAIGVPLGYVAMQGKRLLQFSKTRSQTKAMKQARKLR